LRWLHRLDGIPAEVQGEFCTLVELEQPSAALAFLQEQGILPLEGELTDEHIDKIHDLSGETRTVLVSLLDHIDPSRAVAVRRVVRLNRGSPMAPSKRTPMSANAEEQSLREPSATDLFQGGCSPLVMFFGIYLISLTVMKIFFG
jgi:hypothetical protein